MRGITDLKRDTRGGAGAKLALAVALVTMPMLYPAKTVHIIKGAQSGWEQLWTIEGLGGGGA